MAVDVRQAERGGEPAGRVMTGELVRKLVVEVGPIIVFVAGYLIEGMFLATAFFMAAVLAGTAVALIRPMRLPTIPLVSLGLVLLFGGLTLVFGEESWIQMRPTVANAFFAAALLAGRAAGHDLLKRAFGDALHMADDGWRVLTLRVAAFLLALAVVNEAIRHSFSTDIWVAFKAVGLVPLSLAFAAAQFPLIRRHRRKEAGAA